MKKSYCIAIIIIFIVCVLLISSLYKTARPTEVIDPNLYTIVPGIGIGSVKFNMSKEEIIRHFGEPDEMTNQGMCLLYKSKGFTLTVSPKSGLQFITCYTKAAAPPFSLVNDFPGSLNKGIAMRASKTEIVAAYGLPDKEIIKEKYQTNLTYDKLGIEFILLKDKLLQFFIKPVKADMEKGI